MSLSDILKYTPIGLSFDILGKGFPRDLRFGAVNLLKGVTGSGLTTAQQEANAFEAAQAQKQMDFQQQMSNTAYQRQVADMKASGINPALAMSSSSGASTPSGAMAASEGVSNPDLVGLLGQIANLSLLRSQKRNIDADTEKKLADTEFSKANLVKAGAEVQQIMANTRKLGLDADSQSIVNGYLDRIQNVTLQNMSLEGDVLSSQWTETQQKIANLRAEESKVLQDIVESKERVNYLLSQEALNAEQISEIKATISKITQETDNLVKTGKLTDKDIDFYEWNHGSDIVLGGQRTGTKYIPSKKYRDNNR